MADLRCPMCGKPNPADREECQYCQARLKPLWVGEPPENAPETEPGSEGDLPDWLRSMRQLGEDDEQPQKDESRPSPISSDRVDSAPDWLSSLRGESQEAEPLGDGSEPASQSWYQDMMTGSGAEPEETDEPPDLLSRIGGEPALREPLGQSEPTVSRESTSWMPRERDSSEAADVPDWLRPAGPSPAERSVTEKPDWLNGSTAAAETPAEPASDLTDWLSSLSAGAEATAEPASEIPDWLSGPIAGAEAASEPTSEIPDWLSSPTARTESTAEPASELPDWLSGPSTGAEAEAKPASEIPDWLSGPTARVEAAAEPASDIPDWLSSPTARTESASEPASDLTDWLSGLSAGAETAAEPASEIPDWLSSPTADVEASAEPASEIPDWLSRPSTEAESAAEPAPDLTDWLSSLSAGDGVPAEPASEIPEQLGQELADAQPAEILPIASDIPDWLTGMGDEGLIEPAAIGAELGEQPDEFSTWLSGITAGSAAVQGEQPAEPAAELPDWMKADTTPVVQDGEGGDAGWLSGDASLDWLAEEADQNRPAQAAGELPDWLAGEMEAGLAPEEGVSQAQPGEMPEWMASMTSSGFDVTDISAFADEPADNDLSWINELAGAGELPEAFRSVPQEETEEGGIPQADKALPSWVTSQVEAGAEANLVPSALPGWLQAMRPVGPLSDADETTPRAEGAGPLTGLRGALPAESVIMQMIKPPAYAARVNVSDIHQANATVLQQLLETEGTPRPTPARTVISSLSVLRIAMAFLLILPVMLSLLNISPQAAVPANVPGVSDVVLLINNLPSDAPVLLTIDYQPGMSGEMDTLTGAVIEHLIAQGAYLTLVSTVPTGPLQGEHLLSQVRDQKKLAYSSPQNYANLGFVPSGSAGLLALTEDLRRVFPFDLNQGDVWKNPQLQPVNNLADFSLVIVATENPEIARGWIEQVGPQLDMDTPILLLSSAQLEPLVRPYYDMPSPQIKGLVAGLPGAAAYERLAVQSGVATRYWAPFTVGMAVGGLLMFLGALYQILTLRVVRRRERPGRKEPVKGEQKT